MKKMTSLVSLVISLALATPQAFANTNTMEANLKRVDDFVNEFQKSAFTPLLMDDGLKNVLATNNINLIMQAQVNRVGEVYGGPQEPIKRLEWSEQQADWQRRASVIAKGILSQSIEEMNLTLLALLHRYLTDGGSRLALNYINDSLFSYRFSPEELYRIRKEASVMKQYADGSVWAIIGASVVMMASGKRLPQLLERLGKVFSRSGTAGGHVAEQVASHSGQRTMTGAEILARLDKSGLGAAVAQTPKLTSVEVARDLSKIRFFSRVNNVLSKEGLRAYALITAKNLGLVTGVSVVGGLGNVGLQALGREISPESFSNKDIEFADLRENFYDGLAALRLACLSHDYLTRVRAEEHILTGPENLRALILEMNQLYTEFEILKRINISLVDVTPLPREIQVDGENGKITFKTNVRGRPLVEEFECAKLKGAPNGNAAVSLNEVLVDVVRASQHISELIENETKVRDLQDKRTIIPGEAR